MKKIRKRKLSDATKQSVWLWEFSKRLLVTLTVIYFIAVIYSMVIMSRSGNYDALATFIEANANVMRDGVIIYGLKAGIENTVKISRAVIKHVLEKKYQINMSDADAEISEDECSAG